MKRFRYMLMLVAVMVPISAWAQYAPFQPPGGLAPETTVGSGTLAKMLTDIAASQSGLSAETTRATGAEATLQSNINTEATTRANVDAGLQSQLDSKVWTPSSDDGTNSPVRALFYYDITGQPWMSVGSSSGSFNVNLVPTKPGAGYHLVSNISLNSVGNPVYVSDTGATSLGITTFDDANTEQITQIAYQHIGDYISFSTGSSWVIGATRPWVIGQIATGYTVATLPTDERRYAGARAYVTDASVCNFMAQITGGGSTVCPAFFNGSTWVAE